MSRKYMSQKLLGLSGVFPRSRPVDPRLTVDVRPGELMSGISPTIYAMWLNWQGPIQEFPDA